MKKEKKELIEKFKAVIEDLMDNYDKYTDEEKTQIKEVFENIDTIIDVQLREAYRYFGGDPDVLFGE